MLLFTAEATPAFHEKLLLWQTGGVLRALDLRGYETRNESVLRLIEQAEQAHALPDFGPVMVHTGDRPINQEDPSWRPLAFSRAEGFFDLPVPDFVFDGWPQSGLADYEATTTALAAAGTVPAQVGRLGWIGNCDTNPIRWRLHELAEQAPELLDVHHVSWVSQPGAERLATASRLGTTGNNYMSLEEQVRRWALLIDVEGNGLSGRLKLLLHSGRPLLIQERPWQEWYMDDLVPMVHFIPVRRDLSDLPDRLRWALEHPDKAAAIGRQGQAFAQTRLRRADAVARWAEAFAIVAAEPRAYAPAPARQVLDPAIRQLSTAVPVAG